MMSQIRLVKYKIKKHVMKKVLLIFGLLINFSCITFAQNDTIVKTFQKEFNQFKQTIEQEHQQFKNQNDSVFAKFLKDSWEEFDVFYNKKEGSPKPVIQPVVKETLENDKPEPQMQPVDSSKSNISEPIKIEIKPEKKTPVKEPEHSGRAMLQFEFYGTENSIANPGNLPLLSSITGENISAYFNKICNSSEITELITQLKKAKTDLLLNDWGYYKLVEKTAQTIETSQNRQILFIWLALLKSGYNAKTGYNDNNIYLLLPTREEIFATYYLTIDGVQYYIQSDRDKNQPISRLKIHTANYPGNEMLSLAIKKLPLLGINEIKHELMFKGEKISVSQNQTLKEFYDDYPLCEMNIYFSAPLSRQVKESLAVYFDPLFISKTEKQKVALLLEFVQKAFGYKTDKEQFSQEKYFFPDDLFFYPYSDCEDRSVLFTSLVRNFTNLECIALDFPGHVNTAVCFSDETVGTLIAYNNKKYVVCDPTFANAPVGYLAPEYRNQKPEIITFE